MATYFEYKCKKCGHTVNANPKGKDMVMMGEVHNYLCSECKEIVDVLYEYGKKPEKIDTAMRLALRRGVFFEGSHL